MIECTASDINPISSQGETTPGSMGESKCRKIRSWPTQKLKLKTLFLPALISTRTQKWNRRCLEYIFRLNRWPKNRLSLREGRLLSEEHTCQLSRIRIPSLKMHFSLLDTSVHHASVESCWSFASEKVLLLERISLVREYSHPPTYSWGHTWHIPRRRTDTWSTA